MYNNQKNQYLNISDLNFNSEFYELTDDELSHISGGGLGALGGAVAGAGGSILSNLFHYKEIDWADAAAWGLAGAAGGAIAGSLGGLAGAALAGED
ncbi:MAG: bacteriocin [Nostoc sp.]|uniref:bacteriocin n=1 Tax=Nostoc sp. TaxID=1180 RepID=UPI002FFCC6C7